jgi:cysteine desulfurase
MSSKYGKKSCPNPIYFDNNATTLICPTARTVHTQWLSCYNASSDSKIAKPAKQMLEKAVDSLLSHCGVSTATHTAVFTSGATESNCMIIRMCVKAYKKKLVEKNSELLPHVILSSVEHSSSLECVKDLVESGDVDVTYVMPTIYGNILPSDVEKEIKPNTCLISIMYANNEIPVINAVREIGEIAHKNRIPFHSDCVQIFGKYKIDVKKNNIDVLSASAHKFYGPKGVGILIINNDLIEGYGLTAEINGTQQRGLRGGTENVAGIASTMTALKAAFTNRKAKNAKLFKLRKHLLQKLEKHFKMNDYINYVYDTPIDSENNESKNTELKDLELVSLGPPESKAAFILPNTVLLAICKNIGKPFCNVELKKFLDSKGIVISIGSACNTNSDKASHVLSGISAPAVIKRGVIRISFGDMNTVQEIDKFIPVLVQGIKKQCADIKV